MTVFNRIADILSDILDIPASDISADSYLVRDLNAESIDLLEIAVTLATEFKTDIDDDAIFLKNLRIVLDDAGKTEECRIESLACRYPFLDRARITDIVKDLDGGPVLKVRDLTAYVLHKTGQVQ